MSKNISASLHREAMVLAEQSSLEKLKGHSDRALQLLREAFEKERAAADACSSEVGYEPTRSVLHRSAASLALECGELREAEKLIARALTGNPPDEIATELRDILEQVYFNRHLEVRGVVLSPEEFQVSITGNSVGFGVAQSDVFLSRIQDLEKLLYRTAERKSGDTFRERGKPRQEIARRVQLFVSVPRAASFAISVRIGHSTQLSLTGLSFPEMVIEELLDCMDLFGNQQFDELQKRIMDPPYLRNFVGLAKRIAPDGEDVRMVGFTARLGHQERSVTLRASHLDRSIASAVPSSSSVDTSIRIIGNLRFANSLQANRDEIRVVDELGATHKILVPPGMMDDIVRPLWRSTVRVSGKREGKAIRLDDIERFDPPDSAEESI